MSACVMNRGGVVIHEFRNDMAYKKFIFERAIAPLIRFHALDCLETVYVFKSTIKTLLWAYVHLWMDIYCDR